MTSTRFNPFTKKFDLIEDDVVEVISASATPTYDLELDDATNRLYVWINGHRRYVDTILDDPAGAGAAGSPMGLLLALTYP